MPLLSGSSDEVVRENISREIRHGKKRSQAVAIAMSKAGRGKKKKKKSSSSSGAIPMVRGY